MATPAARVQIIMISAFLFKPSESGLVNIFIKLIKYQCKLSQVNVFILHGLLTLSLPEKLKNSIFEMSIIPQILNINNSGTTKAKSIHLHTIRKVIEYSLKNVR